MVISVLLTMSVIFNHAQFYEVLHFDRILSFEFMPSPPTTWKQTPMNLHRKCFAFEGEFLYTRTNSLNIGTAYVDIVVIVCGKEKSKSQ